MNTTPWFRTEARIAALRAEADKWRGTPFFPNGNTLGVGVSCQKLASALYAGCGWKEIPVPEVSMAHARFGRESLLEPFMDARQEFVRVGISLADLAAGDLLGFNVGQCVHHCGVYLGNSLFVHCVDHIGTTNVWIGDPTWRSRLAVAWRPVEEVQT